ncbi:MAG: hypothetical protein GY941_19565, partial [Planctomycetes bacterium]|nr:hypothetical protein [Planctomycetota bacterium]
MTSQSGMLSTDGRCFTFDARANGFVPGEGVGVILLKRLDDALRDKDPIHGIIRGWGVNQDGKTNGITAPSVNSQIQLEKEVYQRFGIDPATISLVEAHGTGTGLGDPIEVEALLESFESQTSKKQTCVLGSVKSNIGHLLTAAGVSGVIKVLLCLEHQKLVPHANFKTLNPHIALQNSRFYINTKLQDWKTPAGIPRRASISSFGFSGTNAHLVIEEAPPSLSEVRPKVSTSATNNPLFIPLSAKNSERLCASVNHLYLYLQQQEGTKYGQEKASEDGESKKQEVQRQLSLILAEILQFEVSHLDLEETWEETGMDCFQLSLLQEKLLQKWNIEVSLEELSHLQSGERTACYLVEQKVHIQVQGLKKQTLVKIPKQRIEDIAYTLQVGRSVMEERVVFIVKNESDLMEKLQSFLESEELVKDCYRGSVTRKEEQLGTLLDDEDMSQTIASWITKKRYSKLMKLWVKGLVFDWNQLYKDTTPTRIHLPTYPFARERYWIIDTQKKGIIEAAEAAVSFIHPLLHENTSDLTEQRFTSTFTGHEFFLNDHQVKGEKVFPGVGCLEMARAAVEMASGERDEGMAIHFKNIVWTQPIVVDGSARKVHIGLFGEDDDQIQYEVYTESDNGEEAIVHSQGIAEIKKKEETPPIDIQELQSQMNQGTLSEENCYQAFKDMRIDYGEGYRGIWEIYRGEDQLLARLLLPPSVQETQSEYLLHPSLMDSALQSSIGLMLKKGASANGRETPPCKNTWPLSIVRWTLRPSLPFSLESLTILSHCTKEMYAWVRYSGGSTPSDKVQKLDIDLCDEQGKVCVKMRGVTLQELDITSQDQKTVELSPSATDFGISSLIQKPKTVELKSLSGLEVISIDSSFENKRSPVGVSLQTSHSLATSLSSTEALHPDPSTQPLISKETLQKTLKLSLAKALYMKESEIDKEKPFIEMGLDSIVGVEWIKAINQEYRTSVSATKVYDYPTIEKFALFLEQEIKKLPTSLSRKTSTATFATFSQTKGSIPVISSLHHHIKARRKPTPIVVNGRGVSNDKIAIVGMSGRYPDAYNLNQYWDNLVQGKNSIREISQSRWDVRQYFDPDPTEKGKVYCKWLGMLDDIDCFDPLFFQISPLEAEAMDPQHRLFLQEGYKAFEDAGYSNDALSNTKCGVYLGIMSNEYLLLLSQRKLASIDTTGNSYAIAAARIAYYLNLKGPAIPVDTACSSSLVALHLACQALLNHEIDMALTGGVSLYLTPESYMGMCQAGMLSPEGQCKTFDDSADGFVPGEGVGTVVLKRLKDAERDNDLIYGVIIGSGINQDGKTNGITAPNVNSQIELERDIYTKYKIDPEAISYAETHGTGTRLGDPIELEALSTVFEEKTSKKNYCALASVKSNIGHTSGAAGVASVQKVLLSMKHQKLVPSLNCTKENIHFDFKNSPFYVNKETKVWETDVNSLRRACVSAFGISGTNAHVVLEEYIAKRSETNSSIEIQIKDPVIIPLSARTKDQLEQRARDLFKFLRSSMPLHAKPRNKDSKNQLEGSAQLGEKIAAMLANLLHVEKDTLDSGQSFRDYGVEPIHLTKLFDTIRQEYDLDLDVDEWIKQDSIESLLHYCLGEEKESPGQSVATTPAVDLKSLAYTLQIGREAMEERLGFVVTTVQELGEKLEAYLTENQENKECYQGEVKRNNETLAVFSVDEELQEAIEKWIV